jgi:hypothetical protein
MKIKAFAILLTLFTAFCGDLMGQKTEVLINKCHLPSDSIVSLKITLSEIQSWADSIPLKVICNDGNSYKIHQYGFSIFYKNPMQVKEFGVGNDGIPILARKAINNLKKDDTVLLKDVIAIDGNGTEVKLPTISFKVKE